MRFLKTLVLKQKFDQELMINKITCSMLESISTSEYDATCNGVSELTVLETIIKQSMK